MVFCTAEEHLQGVAPLPQASNQALAAAIMRATFEPASARLAVGCGDGQRGVGQNCSASACDHNLHHLAVDNVCMKGPAESSATACFLPDVNAQVGCMVQLAPTTTRHPKGQKLCSKRYPL